MKFITTLFIASSFSLIASSALSISEAASSEALAPDAAASAPAIAAPTPNIPLIPIKDFVKHGDYLNMELSPDGKHISARMRSDGKVYVIFLETATMKVVGGIRPSAGDELHSTTWINNERVVYQFSEKVAHSEQPVATGELFAINVDGSKSEPLYGYRAGESSAGSRLKKREYTRATPNIISKLVNDDDEILIIEHPWSQIGNYFVDDRKQNTIVSSLNIYTGRKKKVETLPYPGADALATDDGTVKFMRWQTEDNDIRVAYRENEDSPWGTIDVPEARTHIPFALSANGENVFFSGQVGEEKFYTVFELDIKTGEYTQLFDNLRADIYDYNWDPDLEKPVVGFAYPDKAAYHYASGESKTATLHKQLVAAFGGQQLSITSQSDSLSLIHVYSDVNPGEYYLFDSKSNDAKFLWANRSWLDPREMANKQPINFTSSDGIEVNGYLTLPKNLAENEKAPMVVVIHGGPHGVRDYWNFEGEVQLFANRGYAVLQVNYRGSGGFGDKFEKAGYLQWGSGMIQDIIEGTQFSVDNFPIDENRMCLYGASYGGYAALMATVRAPDTYKCTVGYVGVYDLNYVYSESDIMDLMGGESYLNDVIGTDKEVLNEFSPINHVDKIKANVMLIHGEKDSRVPVINAESMLEKLEASGKTVPYLNFSKSGHGVWDEEGRYTLYKAVLEFLDENIGE